MAQIRKYYDLDWRIEEFKCPDCGWSGKMDEMSNELFNEVMDFSCPSCDKMILIVSYPTLDEIEEAAASGNAEAIAQLRGTREN